MFSPPPPPPPPPVPDHHRSDRVAAAMREEIALFLANDVKDPRVTGLVTVTAVDVTRDLRHAKVFVSVLGSEVQRAATFEALTASHCDAHLRGRVGRALRLRVAPEIEFRNDESIAHAAHIEQLLAQVRRGGSPEGTSLPPTRPTPPGPDDRAGPDGLLLVDKPAGVTSHDGVLAARRAFGVSRIGHAGTLDPFATGLLVLLLGRATRLLPHLDGVPKVYEATITFGTETDTDDLHGAVVREAAPPTEAAIARGIEQLTGPLDQLPPAYSAKRVGGRRAYDAARAGEALELAPARVEVFGWHDMHFDGATLRANIECGGGTYIRALARDLGRLTASAAHLSSLRRTRSGPFSVSSAVSLDTLRAGEATLRPALDALPTIPHVALTGEAAEQVFRGIAVSRTGDAVTAALVDERSGALVAYAVADGARWQPRVVMQKVG